jgi:hypothetical protein
MTIYFTADIVEMPKWNYLMIDGEGDTNTTQSFQAVIEKFSNGKESCLRI